MQAQLEDDRATTAIWELEIFGGRPSWKVTGLQLQSGNSRFFGAGPVGRRQGYNCNLGPRDFWGQPQLEGDRVTTAIWELEIFWVAGPVGRRQGFNCNLGTRDFLVAGLVGRRQGYNCNLGTRGFWWQAQLEDDRAATAIWELEILVAGRALFEGDGATTAIWELESFLVAGPLGRRQLGLQLQSGNSRFFWVAGPVGK